MQTMKIQRKKHLFIYTLIGLLGLLLTGIVSAGSTPEGPYTEFPTLTASDDASDFGSSVSIDGDIAVVGDRYNDGLQGAAYVYQLIDGTWQETQKLTANDTSDGVGNDYFGASVVLSGDTIVVGASGNYQRQGRAFVFKLIDGTWTKVAKLTASDRLDGDSFGTSVDISGDTIVVGASGDDIGANNRQGSAYVFVEPETGWEDATQDAKLTTPDTIFNGSGLGHSVSIDGDTIVVGVLIPYVEAAFVYIKPESGWANMTEATAKLTSTVENSGLGTSVSIDGDTIAVGAENHQIGENQSQGSVHVYVKPAGVWTDMTQTAVLTGSDGLEDDDLGISVSIDNDIIVAGATHATDEEDTPGKAYVFVKPETGWADMTQFVKLTPSNSSNGDGFGRVVDISGDFIIVGTYFSNTAHIFEAAEPTVANADAPSIGEDATATVIAVLDNDQGDNLNVTAIDTTGTTGQATLNSGVVSYAPNGQFEGLDDGETALDAFNYSITGADLKAMTATVTVTITGANDAPVAVADSFNTNFETTLAGNVLSNDTDIDEEDIDVVLISEPNQAKDFIIDAETGNFTFTPVDGFSGVTTFTYQATDGDANSATVTVSITVGQNPNGGGDNGGNPVVLNTLPELVSITANPSSGNFVAGQTISIIINFSEPMTLTDGNMIVNFTNGQSVEVPPFNNQTVVTIAFTIPDGFGNTFSPAAAVPFDVASVVLSPGAILFNSSGGSTNGGTTGISIAPPTGQSLGDNTNITVDNAVVSPDAACPQIAPLTATEANGAPEAPDYICVIPNQGRPTIVWRNDDRADWYNIWIGNGETTVLFDWFSKPDAIFADANAVQAQCEGLTCTLKPDINPAAGSYEVWMQAWGTPTDNLEDGLYSVGGPLSEIPSWNGGNANEPASGFTYNATPSGPVTPMTPTIADGKVSLQWAGVEGATWYNVWLGTAPNEFSERVFVWALAENLGCENGGTCTLTKDTEVVSVGGTTFDLTAGEYIWYIQSWGPAGFNTGGIEGTSFVQADTFTVP